jgi:uncharacterized protein YdeI (YjbR/CyaY-like superfamily)
VYTWQGRNVVVIHEFKDSCTIGFFKGSLLTDAYNILEKPGKNTQGPMVVRFRDVREIYDMEDILKAYIKEAIEVEKAGLKVEMKDLGL